MKACQEVERLLYLTDEELNPEESVRVSAHLDICHTCRDIHEQVIRNRNAIVYPPVVEEPARPIIVSRSTVQESRGFSINVHADRVFRIFRWTVYVAASLLILLFMGEQAHSVNKILTLEENQANIGYAESTLADRWVLKESIQLKNTMQANRIRGIGWLKILRESVPDASGGYSRALRSKNNIFIPIDYLLQSKQKSDENSPI